MSKQKLSERMREADETRHLRSYWADQVAALEAEIAELRKRPNSGSYTERCRDPEVEFMMAVFGL